MKLRTIIADDERIARTRLRRMIADHPDVEVVAECSDGAETLAGIREHRPDLVLLDIEMPGMNGFEVLSGLPNDLQPLVIFITAYDEHAVRAFEACALDYLLKPTSPDRLSKALARARTQRNGHAQSTESVTPPKEAGPASTHRFTVRSGGRIVMVSSAEIDWVEAAGNYVILHVGKSNHMIRETMGAMETALASNTFLRVSRSAIVNLQRVKELSTAPAGSEACILRDGRHVHATRSIQEIADKLRGL